MFHVPSSMQDKGFTLLETTVAIFIVVVAIVAAFSAFYRIMVVTSSISSRLTAAYLAQEGIEIIRNIRDTNWLKGSNWDSDFNECKSQNGCEADYTTGTGEGGTSFRTYSDSPLYIANNFYSYKISGTETKFKRKITIIPQKTKEEDEEDNILDVSVLVEWEDRGKEYNFTAEEQLYNWH